MSSCFFVPLPHGIVIGINMAAVDQSTYELFIGGTEAYAIDMDDKIKGVHLRGTKYTVSQDGLCPRCGNSNRLYVILDKLFPMGDMPEILHKLITKGRAILWSSQEKEGYRDPPTFLCRGFCPPDPLGAGFNVNWDNVSLNQILQSLDRPVQKAINPVSSSEESSIQVERSSQDESSDNSMQVLDEFRAENSDDERNLTQTSVAQSSSDKEEETEEDEEEEEEEEDDDDELDEEELIKQMLAKEQQKISQENNHGDTNDNENEETDAPSAPSDSEHISEQTSSSSDVINSTTTVTTSATETVSHSNSSNTVSSTANAYPVSSTGRCPYCSASDVKYIIIVSQNTKDTELPQSLQELLKRNHAFKMAKGDSEPPSFQCQKCQYGFNLNWSKTNLEEIFGLQPSTSIPAATTAAPYTSTASMPYQARPASYMTSATYPRYPPPSVLPPGYPPPVGVPPPVPYHSYPPTYPSYYGSYYHPPAIPQPAGSYSPYSPAVVPPRIPLPGTIPPGMPPPGILPPGIPPPGISPPGIPPPGMPPPAIPPPGIPPPGIPTPGIPLPGIPPTRIPPPGIPTPGIPPPGIRPSGIPPPPVVPPPRTPPPGYVPPALPRIPPPATVWGNYTRPTYPTRPQYPPASTGYLLPPTGRPYQPPPQIVTPLRARAPHSLYQPAVHSGMSAPLGATPSQQEPSAEQTVEGEISKVAAARFEMVLNQIDLAKARVRHEKELMKEFRKEVLETTVADTKMLHQQDTEEPNALTDEGQSMPEYDEKPPGDDDTGFDSNVIITQSLEETKIADSPVNTSIPAHSVSSSQPMPADINEKPQVPVHEHNAETGNVTDNAAVETGLDSKKDLDDEDVEYNLPQTKETSPKKTVPTRGGRPGRSKQQNKLQPPTARTSTRQTRRSRKSEPSTEDTDSTTGEEEAAIVTGRSSRSQKTRPPSRGVKRLEIGAVQDEKVHGGIVASDVEMGESSDVLSQSSAVPQTESDSQEVPSESLPSSSEAEAASVSPSAIARPQRGRATRCRKRKQESVEKEVDVPGPSVRKSRRVATENLTVEELHSEENDEVKDEKMLVDNPVVLSHEENTEMTTTSPRVARSKRGVTQPDHGGDESTADGSNLDQSETESTTVTQEPDKPTTEIRTSIRQTRRSAQMPQEQDELTVSETRTDPRTEESKFTVQEEDGAQEDEKSTSNRRTRRSAPRNVSQTSVTAASHRQTRNSLQLQPQESNAPDTGKKVDSEQDQRLESDTRSDNGLTDGQPSVLVEQKEIAPNGSLGAEGKANRRTRKSGKSSASSEDASVSIRVDVHASQGSDASTTTEEGSSNRQTRSRKPPALRKLETTQSDTPTLGEAEQTPPTRKSRRRSSASNEDATTGDVQLSVAEPDTSEGSASSRRTLRNKSTPTTQEAIGLPQELDSLTTEGDLEEEDSIMPQKRASRKSAPVESTATVTKRVSRNRRKK